MLLSIRTPKNEKSCNTCETSVLHKSRTEIFNTINKKNLYHLFSPKQNDKYNEIVKTTKEILTNNTKFKQYLTNYSNSIQIPCFKSPLHTHYPLLNSNSQSLIPIHKTVYDYSNDVPKKIKRNNIFLRNNKIKSKPKMLLCVHSSVDHKRNANYFDYMINELVDDWKYNEMPYEEKEIFYNEDSKENINNFLKNRIQYIKDNNKIENKDTLLEKHYSNKKSEMTLKLHPIKIIFHNISDTTKPNIVLEVPFAFSFAFYYNNFKPLKYVLLSIIKFNSTFDSISLNEEELYEYIKNSNEFETKKKKISFKLKKIEINSKKISTEEHTDYNVYTLTWYTPKYTYEVEISFPDVSLTIPKGNVYINLYLPSTLYLFLYEHHFKSWEFYVLHYLFSLKKVRNIIERYLSKNNLKMKTFSGLLLEEDKTIMNRKVKYYNKESNSSLYFFYTNTKSSNYIYKVNSYTISITYEKLNPSSVFWFDFDFKQMKTLYNISRYQTLDNFIQKIMIADFSSGSLLLNYSIIDNFDFSIFKNEKPLTANHSYSRANSMTNTSSSNEYQIHIEYPNIEKIEYTSFSTISHDYIKKTISPKVLNSYSNNQIDMIKWGSLFIDLSKTTFTITNKFSTKMSSKGEIKMCKRMFSIVEPDNGGCVKRVGTFGRLKGSLKSVKI